ncbi:outer membrane protein assembly factor BamD [Pelagibacteraceae bacterium]|nr:outer membrane protein assembly factor BamD [Pelagibacteraceae bacterium]
MFQKFIYILLLIFFTFGCSKEEPESNIPGNKEQAFEIYSEAIKLMKESEFMMASKKFSEAEIILPKIEQSAKASLMASFCLYSIRFYPEAIQGLERFISSYPVDKNIAYAHYLITLSLYEQILDETKDINPLIQTKEKIQFFLKEFPGTDYSLDLQFKLDLINNQLAAKELYIAKYYIEVKKWIPAINRLKVIVNDYNETIFIEEALHRLVEVYYNVGLVEEARNAAVLLGYNYNSSKWYKQSYQLLNKNYQMPVLQKNKKNNESLIKKTINKILNK